MSLSGRTENVALLRAVIARIEGGQPALGGIAGGQAALGGKAPRRPDRLAKPLARRVARPGALAPLPLGAAGLALDRLMGGGLRQGALHEIAPETPRDEGAASGFALALAARCLPARGTLVWIVDDGVAADGGAPYRPGLSAHGLDPDRIIVVRTRGARATLWAAEEALQVRGILVLVDLWGGRHYGLVPSRRLVLAARGSGTTGLLRHAGLPGGGRALSSSCQTRFVVAASPSPHRAAASGPLPVPGATAFALRLDKLRSPASEVDPAAVHTLLWNAAQRCFHDPDLPVALASPPADRPAPLHHAKRSSLEG